MKPRKSWVAIGLAVALVAPAIVAGWAASAEAQTYSVLYSFRGKHGINPYAGLVRDVDGNLYGTTVDYRGGTVFQLKPNGTEKVLHRFRGKTDGRFPYARLVRDSKGDLYGTTQNGGDFLCQPPDGCGIIFRVDTSGNETVLHRFNLADGAWPAAGLVLDSAGNLFGTTEVGGTYGYGALFKLDTAGAETVLHSFTGGVDGGYPSADLVLDSTGILYGTTYSGGANGCCGVVFKFDAKGVYTVLYSFGGADGSHPSAGLLRDPAGNLYGTTVEGGAYGPGVVFELKMNGKEKVLYSFTDGKDGGYPRSALVQDSPGNLYGTTWLGGAYNSGVVFKLNKTGTETLLHTFTSGMDGYRSYAGLIRDPAGNLYGTTYGGGAYKQGVVFRISPH